MKTNEILEKSFEDIRTIHENNRINRKPMSDEGKKLVSRAINSSQNPKEWHTEYREHMCYQIVYALINPFPPRKRVLAKTLGISLQTLNLLINTRTYTRIKNELRRDLRSKWGAEIDQIVIRKALQGSKYHADLYYNLQGELIQKMEVTKRGHITGNKVKIRNQIKRYLKELKMD